MGTRREFFRQANCAAVGTVAMGSTLFTLRMAAGAATGSPPAGYKALVCLFLSGGNDSFNMLVPRNASAYAEYAAVRTTLALDASTGLLPVVSAGQPFAEFGIHHKLPFLQTRYNAGDLAFVANVGTLVEPTTLAQYNAGGTATPVGLFSHADEQVHWQTIVPQVRGASPKGWAGRVADCMVQSNLGGSVGMNISLSGNNVMQVGAAAIPYITDPKGVVLLKDYSDPAYASAVDALLARQYGNLYHKTLAATTRSAVDTAVAFEAAVGSIDFSADFPSSQAGDRLRTVAEILSARSTLGMDRQIFFVERGGWDHHNEVIASQENLFTEINAAIEAFWNKLVALGLQNDVVLFTVSDFGRTLTSNGLGSDHAWGGNAFVLGGAVNGGKIHGQFPVLAAGGPLDIGRGRLLPTTPVDAYCADLASWFGVPAAELETIFPNATNFFDPLSTPYPLGILGP